MTVNHHKNIRLDNSDKICFYLKVFDTGQNII